MDDNADVKKILTASEAKRLERTTWTSSWMKHPRQPQVQQAHTDRSSQHGTEPSTLESSRYKWCNPNMLMMMKTWTNTAEQQCH